MIHELLLKYEGIVSEVWQEWFDHFLTLRFDQGKAGQLVDFYLRDFVVNLAIAGLPCKAETVFLDSPQQVLDLYAEDYTLHKPKVFRNSVISYLTNGQGFESHVRNAAMSQLAAGLMSAIWPQCLERLSHGLKWYVKSYISRHHHERLERSLNEDSLSKLRDKFFDRILEAVKPLATKNLMNQLPPDNSRALVPARGSLSRIKDDVFRVIEGFSDQRSRVFPAGDISDFGWVSFYDAMQRVGLMKCEDLDSYMDLIRANVFAWVVLPHVVAVIKPPTHISLDGNNRLHSVDYHALKFADGYGQYWINGVNFSDAGFDKFFIAKSFTPGDIMRLPNVEQRAALIQHFGLDFVLDHLHQRKLIDSHEGISNVSGRPVKYALYDCNLGGRPHTFRFVLVEDHSTHKRVTLGVPVARETQTCRGAIAWTFGMSEEEYVPLMET
jgi:hypothetical protein